MGLAPRALAALAMTPSSSLNRAEPTCRGPFASPSLMPNWTIRKSPDFIPLSMAGQRVEYVVELSTHSPAEFFVLVTLGSYSQVWTLRPPTALLFTVTPVLK
ncbi:hypothetical protein ACFQX7_39230 [Luedemannella flava]